MSFPPTLKWYCLLIASILLIVSTRVDLSPATTKLQDDSEWHRPVVDWDRGAKRSIERFAILRPFSPRDVESLSHAFDEWNTILPCHSHKHTNGADGNPPVLVDVFISFSQTFQSFKPARDHVRAVIDGFAQNYNATGGWEQCITSIRQIEANVDPRMDLYDGDKAYTNRMWVHGPNQQFINSMHTILAGEFGHYDAIFLMEADVLPHKQYWLDSLLEEAEKEPFMILGSEYMGHNWDELNLPLSLQHHVNGNAVYNVTHPLLNKLLTQLRDEEDTPYHAIPYDYRISQILVEGMLGILPEMPSHIVKDWSEDTAQELQQNTEKFRAWWEKYGRSGKHGSTMIRKSQVLANYAKSNLLPRQRDSIEAALIHGAVQYASWDSGKYDITLVISEWHDELAYNLLSQIDTSTHPFSNVILMVPHNMASHGINRLSSIKTHVNVSINKRNSDTMDICDAPVKTEYFMMTNSYHVVSRQIGLLFTNDSSRLPVIPFIRADRHYCSDFQPCTEAYAQSKQFDHQNMKIVQDFDMLFKTDLRDEFCSVWRQRYGEESMHDEGVRIHGPLGPTATAYTSFLSMRGTLSKFYRFTDCGIFGRHDNFKRVISVNKETRAAHGETPLSNYILKEYIMEGDRIVDNDLKSQRYMQLIPSFTPPDATDLPSRVMPIEGVDRDTSTKSPIVNLTSSPTPMQNMTSPSDTDGEENSIDEGRTTRPSAAPIIVSSNDPMPTDLVGPDVPTRTPIVNLTSSPNIMPVIIASNDPTSTAPTNVPNIVISGIPTSAKGSNSDTPSMTATVSESSPSLTSPPSSMTSRLSPTYVPALTSVPSLNALTDNQSPAPSNIPHPITLYPSPLPKLKPDSRRPTQTTEVSSHLPSSVPHHSHAYKNGDSNMYFPSNLPSFEAYGDSHSPVYEDEKSNVDISSSLPPSSSLSFKSGPPTANSNLPSATEDSGVELENTLAPTVPPISINKALKVNSVNLSTWCMLSFAIFA